MPRATIRATGVNAGGPSSRPAARAFTLVEIIVVLVLISILAGVIVPRLAGGSARRVEQEARAVQRLLSTFAEREALGPSTQGLALQFDASAGEGGGGRLEFFVRRVSPGAAAAGANAGVDPRPEFVRDTLVPVVELVDARLAAGLEDGRPLDARRWRISLSPGGPRPAIALVLAPASGVGPSWQVSLASDASTATRRALPPGSTTPAADLPRSIDLDASGKGEEPW